MSDRNSDIATIKIRQKALGLDDDAYRDLLQAITNGKRSSTELDFQERRKVMDHLANLAKHHGIRLSKTARGARQHVNLSREQRYVRAMWISLAKAGKLRDRSDRALDSWVKRMANVDKLEWLQGEEARAAIEAIKAWCAREGLEIK